MIDIWGGIECTINRVGNTFFDQLELNGHYNRSGDIKAIANLGIRHLRYPLLWEKHQPLPTGEIDWSWTDSKLKELQEHNIVPIAGLLHHGSGPEFTNLLQEDFPERLANFAVQVATRYPWIEYYTPVNEPLTTARFSGLYGFWYPHKTNDVSFVKILLNELKAVVLSMQQIRQINPGAKLVQTEDLGKTYSTPLLKYQADFENHRRWLTYDILCGRFNEEHPLWNYFQRLGIPPEHLNFFLENPCPPDIVGVNHYVTSERYLDENLEKYPPWTAAGNSIHAYADVEVVRAHVNEPVGLHVLLREMWERYKLPIVITEAHLHCSRDEQLRWFKEIYDTATNLREDGIDIRAVTSWSLFGAYGWNKLLTDMPGEYETGAFDVSMGILRETALAGFIRSLLTNVEYQNPLLNQKGWWHRCTRFYIKGDSPQTGTMVQKKQRPILIIGKNSILGKAFARICTDRCLEYVLMGKQEIDITNSASVNRAVKLYNPWAIINAAGYGKVEEAEHSKNECFLNNIIGPVNLATKCEDAGIKLINFSSDLVFDGSKNAPYFETDKLNPLNVYGKSKAIAEKEVIAINPSAIIIRTSAFFGPWDKYNFINVALNSIRQGNQFAAVSNVIISPTYLPHLVHASLDLLIDDEKGIWHLANKGAVTLFDFAREAASRSGLNETLIVPVKYQEVNARRPYYSVLDSERGILMPSLEKALNCYFNELITVA